MAQFDVHRNQGSQRAVIPLGAAHLILEELRGELHEVVVGDDADEALVVEHGYAADGEPSRRDQSEP